MIIHVLGVNMFNCVAYTCLSVLPRLIVFGVALRQEYILLNLYSFGAKRVLTDFGNPCYYMIIATRKYMLILVA